MDGVTGDQERQHEVRVNGVSHLLDVHVENVPVVRSASRHHHMVDRGRQVTEKPFEGSRVRGIEGRSTQRFELPPGALEGLGIPASKDHPRTLSACSSSRFQPNAGAPADYDDGLPEEFRFALGCIGGC